jgi:hypothetical protein
MFNAKRYGDLQLEMPIPRKGAQFSSASHNHCQMIRYFDDEG